MNFGSRDGKDKMIRYFFVLVVALGLSLPHRAQAQDTAWVQVEAQPTLAGAQDRVRDYANRLENVAGFYLGGPWYGVVLGPYNRPDAEALLSDLRNQGRIPADSFVVDGSTFRQQFWPIGVGATTSVQPLPGAGASQDDTPQADVVTEVETPAVPEDPAPAMDETLAEARASEATLDPQAKRALQVALQWAGYYDAAIDGSYGRGTRAAMGAWQEANGHEPTGVLTTNQRAALLGAYNAVLEGMDLQLVQDDATGIAIRIPTGAVAFTEYEPPFARFDAKSDDLPAQVLLISQQGDETRFAGLYEILQTLAVVPPDGERARRDGTFTIDAMGDDIRSHTYATREGGEIKGFMLIWPAGDEDRFRRVLAEMQASFARIDGVLDPAIAPLDENQAIDLVAGLEIRKPVMSRSGFFIDRQGDVLTTTEVADQCERLTIDSDTEAEVVHRDDELGLAVLRPLTPLAPIDVASFQTAVPRLQSEIAVAGYPYGGVLAAPSLTFGQLADLRGLNGEEQVKRLALAAQPGDAGGPVFDNGGAVLGMMLPRKQDNGQILPADVSFSLDTDRILASLGTAGINAQTTDTLAFMAPETLTLRAADQTVLVSCW